MSRATTQDVEEIEAALDRIAGSVDLLVDRASPKNIARRGVESLKGRFVDPEGNPRYETIVPVAVGAVAVVATLVGIRRLVS
ncbi:DUF3618 domain-containing protein [Aeromicrobium sp. CTD01-1L150]|uniref:DUF3618 domain-containing protein n=1 Tax=Aeromicrobium sp. CTD01-1L150 TaxID=3341830 RepID=UPI0035BFCB1C